MKIHRYRKGALLGSLILTLGSVGLQAQEATPAPQPPRERPAASAVAPEGVRAERIRQRIRELNQAGKHEEANQLAARVRQAHAELGRRQMAVKPPQEKADKVEGDKADRRQVRKAHAGHPARKGPPPPLAQPPVMKIRNLKMAADLLDAAGYRDHAGQARKEAGRIEGEMRKMAELKKQEDQKRMAEEAKRRAMDTRKATEMKDRPDPNADMRDELKKLRREVEELRGQLQKAKAAAESRPERPARERREEDRPR